MNDRGLRWRKLDLHVHTPGSKDYLQPDVTPEDILMRAQELGIQGIAITDHNTGAWIERVKTAAVGTEITVFPGVEITAPGGQKNIHVVAIFDPSKSSETVNDLLAQIGIVADKRGETEVVAHDSVNEIIDKIAALGGLPLLAHADSPSGVLCDVRGQQRLTIIQNRNLQGAELVKAKTSRFLDGTDPEYQRRLACYQSSDSHSLAELGRRTSEFKIGAMSLTALRQAFIDPETRIRLGSPAPAQCETILGLSVSRGFLAGIDCQFHRGLNALIGGKGVGKSLIIEFLRFALNQPSDVPDIVKDMNGKLAKQLGVGGTVTILCETASGTRLRITRTYDGHQNPTTAQNLNDGSDYQGDISKIFPILAYSQNEIIDIARDSSIQLKMIDHFIDIDSYNQAIGEVADRIADCVNEYVEALFAADKIHSLDRDIGTHEGRIKEIDKVLSDPKFTEQQAWEEKVRFLSNVQTECDRLLKESAVPPDGKLPANLRALPTDWSNDLDLQGYHRVVTDAIQRFDEAVGVARDELNRDLTDAKVHRTAWERRKRQWDEDFQKFLGEIGGPHEALVRQRSQLAESADQLRAQKTQLTATAAAQGQRAETYRGLLDLLQRRKDDLFNARAAIYQDLTTKSNGRLNLTLNSDGDRSKFQAGLTDLCHGMRIQGRFIENLANSLTPREFVEIVLGRDKDELEEKGDLSPDAATKIIEGIPAREESLRDLLRLPSTCMPEDIPEILYQKDDGNYHPLAELSVGQKCTALLLIALSDGTAPVISDQPEDALDVATVYLDVVRPLRRSKDRRQFIITTHNANVAVSSDSDKFHVLKSDAMSASIVCAGAIELDAVAKEVIAHLEGGREPFQLRGRKYGVEVN